MTCPCCFKEASRIPEVDQNVSADTWIFAKENEIVNNVTKAEAVMSGLLAELNCQLPQRTHSLEP